MGYPTARCSAGSAVCAAAGPAVCAAAGPDLCAACPDLCCPDYFLCCPNYFLCSTNYFLCSTKLWSTKLWKPHGRKHDWRIRRIQRILSGETQWKHRWRIRTRLLMSLVILSPTPNNTKRRLLTKG